LQASAINPDANCLLGVEIDRRFRQPVGYFEDSHAIDLIPGAVFSDYELQIKPAGTESSPN